MSAKPRPVRSSTPPIVRRALVDSLRKLDPRHMIRNPVMFVVEVGSAFTTLLFVHALVTGARRGARRLHPRGLGLALAHGAVRELRRGDGRGARQGAGRRAAQGAPRRGREEAARAAARRRARGGAVCACCARATWCWSRPGDTIPADGDVIEGVASVDESAVTGESAPVIRESGGDRSAVTGGTVVLSDWLIVRVSANPGETFLDRMIALVEGAKRQKTPERDRARHPARRPDHRVPAGDRDAAAVLRCTR